MRRALIAGTSTAACAMSDVFATQCTWPAADARRRFLKINFARRMGEICPPAIEFLAAGKADVRPIVADRVGRGSAGRVRGSSPRRLGLWQALLELKRA